MFSQSCRSKQRKLYGDKGWPEYLEGAYVRYKSALSSKYSSMWDFIRYAYYSSISNKHVDQIKC